MVQTEGWAMTWSTRIAVWVGLVSLAVLIVIIGVLGYGDMRHLSATRRQIDHAHGVINGLQELVANLADAEVGERDYLLTHSPTALLPYHVAVTAIPKEIDAVERLVTGDVSAAAQFGPIAELLNTEVAQLDRTLAAAASEAVPLPSEEARGLIEKAALPQIARQVAGMVDGLQHQVDRAEGQIGRDEERTIGYVGLTSIASVLCVGLALWALSLEIETRWRAGAEQKRLKDAAEAAGAAKADFIALLSHELRSPLSAVIGYAELIVLKAGDPVHQARAAEYANHIRRSGDYLLSLVNDLLDFAKVDARRIALREERLALADVIAQCAEMQAPQAQRAGITLSWHVGAGIEMVYADPTRLRQILTNLLSNAVKYTPFGGKVRITAEPDETDGTLVIKVTDTGIGIAEGDLSKVMQAFEQIDNEPNRAHRGTGLGLPLTQRLVELHGGRLELESAAGAGTTARIRLPRERVLAGAAPHQDAAAAQKRALF
jgi:signal transduction histidine kinase